MRQWIASYRLTPIGGLLIAIAICACVVAGVGPSSAQVPALVLGILVGAVLVAGSGVGVRAPRGLDKRRAEFGPGSPTGPQATEDSPVEAEAWQRERERYEARE